jgi:hypothetical protein
MANQLQVGPQTQSLGQVTNERGDNYGALIVAEAQGRYQELARQGYVFAARSGAAAAIPVNTTCTNAPTLWNLANSNKIVVPLFITLSFAGLGTYVIDGFTLMAESGMGSNAATGAPFPTFTNIAPNTTRIGSGQTCTSQFANGTVTWTTQPTAIMDLGVGQNIQGTAASGGPYSGLMFDLQGCVVMNPGTAICIGAATAASSATYWTTIVFAEIPLVSGY